MFFQATHFPWTTDNFVVVPLEARALIQENDQGRRWFFFLELGRILPLSLFFVTFWLPQLSKGDNKRAYLGLMFITPMLIITALSPDASRRYMFYLFPMYLLILGDAIVMFGIKIVDLFKSITKPESIGLIATILVFSLLAISIDIYG